MRSVLLVLIGLGIGFFLGRGSMQGSLSEYQKDNASLSIKLQEAEDVIAKLGQLNNQEIEELISEKESLKRAELTQQIVAKLLTLFLYELAEKFKLNESQIERRKEFLQAPIEEKGVSLLPEAESFEESKPTYESTEHEYSTKDERPRSERGLKVGMPFSIGNFAGLGWVDLMPSKEIPQLQKGKYFYINSWATWCVGCLEQLPFLQKMHEKYGHTGLRVIGINFDEDLEKAREAVSSAKVEFTMVGRKNVLSKNSVVLRMLDLQVMPTSILVDSAGVIKAVHEGYHGRSLERRENDIRSLVVKPKKK